MQHVKRHLTAKANIS